MKPWQIITLGIILLTGYVIFAVGGYLIGASMTEQKWQARMTYVAYAEERVCHTRTRLASDMLAIVAAGQLTDELCAHFRESEGAFGTQAATWANTTPPDEWQDWHAEISAAMEAINRVYGHMTAACDYDADWDFDSMNAELARAQGAVEPAIEALKPEHRPWATSH